MADKFVTYFSRGYSSDGFQNRLDYETRQLTQSLKKNDKKNVGEKISDIIATLSLIATETGLGSINIKGDPDNKYKMLIGFITTE